MHQRHLKKKKEEHLPNHRHDTHKNKGRTLNCFLLQKPSAFFPLFFLNVILHLSVHLTPLHRLPLPLPSSLLPLFPRWKQMATTTTSSFLSIHGRTETHPSPFVVDERKIFFVLFVRLPMPFQAVWSISFFCLFSTRLPMDCLYYTHRKRGRQRKQKKKRNVSIYTQTHLDSIPPSTHSTPVPISNLIIDDEMARARDDCVWSHPRNGHKRPRIYHYTTMQCYSPVTTNPRGGSPVHVEWLVGSPSANGRLWFSRSGGLQYGPVFIACTNAIDLYFLFLFSLSFSVHFNCLYKFLEKRCNRFEMFETIVAYCWRFVGLIFIFIFWCVRALFFKRVFSTSTRRLGKGQSSSLKKLSGIPIEAPPNRVNPRRKANSTIEKIMFN